LHDELLSRLSSPEVHGHVVLGTSDLYAAYTADGTPRPMSAIICAGAVAALLVNLFLVRNAFRPTPASLTR
jgi:hypothetical protein